jgi:phage terminase large subunit-like protein
LETREQILKEWAIVARDSQWEPPGDWRTWMLKCGRGFGKTRSGAEWVKSKIEDGTYGRIALVGPTAADVRDVMIEGESGILAISRPEFFPKYEPSKRRLTWPNGAIATAFSAEEPNRLRGPQHDAAWCDELGSWKYAETWDMLMMGLRLGKDPRTCVTTTPKPSVLVKKLIKDPTTLVVGGSTFENRQNLTEYWFDTIVKQYEGTRLGLQELEGIVLEDNPDAFWQPSMLEKLRVKKAPELKRIVVAVDPAVTSGEDADETGIVVAGIGVDGDGYVLADRSCRMSPNDWARRVVIAYDEFEAERVVAEVNNGGDLVKSILMTVSKKLSYKPVRASKGKRARAEPVAALYEQGRVHHVGFHADLESQMCEYTPDGFQGSPDRVDALVWALTELMLKGANAEIF